MYRDAWFGFCRPGLTVSVWHNIPYYDWAPTSNDITSEQNWAASNAPSYSFINTADTFSYSGSAPTVAGFLGADAAGAAKSDFNSVNYVAFDEVGYIDVPLRPTTTLT